MSQTGIFGIYEDILISLVLAQLYATILPSMQGGFWIILGLVSGAGVLTLSYPLAAAKWVKGVVIGIIILGAIEIISGIFANYIVASLGGGLAIIGSIFGIATWRMLKVEKPAVEAEVEKPTREEAAKKPRAAKAVAAKAPKPVPRAKLGLAQVEGIGPVHATRLQNAKIETLSQLANSSPDEVSTAARVNKKKAEMWINMAKLLLLDEIEEEEAELMVVGARVTSLEDLAKRKPDELYEEMQSAMKMGKVAVPKGYSFTKKDVENWISAAKRK
ncbi:MAG: DUF4332 domain-containing protein [Candidatus Jordarchaeum sp.]|uniref:DUF4332 domain-containing protein n=1 Tax=Candidatus Jordarchaeum sp. TaxID=2823881 RepID=UPI00404B45FB